MIRVAVIDSFPLYRNGIGREVAQQTDMQLVGDSNRGSDALALAREKSPDVIILGLNLDSSFNAYDPVKVIKDLHHAYPGLRVILLSSQAIHVQELIGAGLSGYILKYDLEAASFIQAIRVVYNNEKYYSESIRELLPPIV
jgi:two-component system nitrate/nitrite response regulator NarP